MEFSVDQISKIDGIAYIIKSTTAEHEKAMNRAVICKYITAKAQENNTSIDSEIAELRAKQQQACAYNHKVYYSTELASEIWNYPNLGFAGASKVDDWEIGARLFNCLKRNKINYMSDLLQCSAREIISFRNMGVKSIEELNEFLATRRIEMFTDEELATLNSSYVKFNFYGEDRTFKDFQRLNISKSLINKMLKNGLIETKYFATQKINQTPAILQRVPTEFHKYVVLGLGEDIKIKIKQKQIINNSERIIKKLINTEQVYEDKAPKLKYTKPHKSVLKDRDILGWLKRNKITIFDLDDEFIYNYQNEIWKIIARSSNDLSAKRDLIKYVESMCDRVKVNTMLDINK